MAHAFHDALPGYDERQILHDGCPECEDRGKDLPVALAHLDTETFDRAWRRAFELFASEGGNFDVVGPVSRAETALLRVLWHMQVELERRGFVINGQVPSALGGLPLGPREWTGL